LIERIRRYFLNIFNRKTFRPVRPFHIYHANGWPYGYNSTVQVRTAVQKRVNHIANSELCSPDLIIDDSCCFCHEMLLVDDLVSVQNESVRGFLFTFHIIIVLFSF